MKFKVCGDLNFNTTLESIGIDCMVNARVEVGLPHACSSLQKIVHTYIRTT